ncbi:MAG: molybdate ABC transporter substrate-binding protein [Chitinimonas sp.]|nr:molybdate ABC transporter substrate-binding protein [Chitinimonas sp.]
MKNLILLAMPLLMMFSPSAQAAEVQLAVAANFAVPMQKIAAAFEQSTGHKVLLSSGATGKFYAQISQGAPFEVLLAADDETPRRLVRDGLAIASSQFTYAQGRLALWSPKQGVVDNTGAVLKTGGFNHLAIANPKVAPYGVAATEVMIAMGVYTSMLPKLVQGESIAQAYQFVSTGNAELGFVALSQVYEHGRMRSGSGWVVPAQLHTPIKQDAVLLLRGRDNPAASALLGYLKTDAARAVMASYGYAP